MKHHHYAIRLIWTGDLGQGTKEYRGYSREHRIEIEGKPPLLGSSDPHFRGDPSRHNPEELLVAALASCHMLWYLHLCADAGVVVREYSDAASGTMELDQNGDGRFSEVILRPHAILERGDPIQALLLHDQAHRRCFIARSVAFPVRHLPTFG